LNINQCSKRIKSKREGITYPLFFIETAKKFRGFLSKRRKRKKIIPLWFFISSEVYLEFK